ncbi:YcnI family protein [Mycobacterium sp. NPDC048908]|uniref:YcnI family copper-binding membrane protein n=1 Tax=Mycobacterium sp. NPDC048908 TaxID=3364292 RepID=UPI00371637A2
MPINTRASSRALITGAVLTVGLLACAPTAWAHVHADADNPTPGSYSVVTFRVPNESEKGAMTTKMSVTLPNVGSASTEAMPGWTVKLDRDVAAGTVHSVTWAAAPGAGIAPDQFALFRISVKLPDTTTISLPATQTYSDGTVVKWDQPTAPGGAEPDHPAPEIALRGSAVPAAAADETARWLAGGALALGAVAVAASLLVRRRA